MREIIFKGRVKDEEQSEFYDKWFYGDLIQLADGSTFIRQQESGTGLEVIPETVGQYSGVRDRNGNKIFEGDIVDTHANFEDPYVREVIWGENCGLEFKPLTGYNLCKANEHHFKIIRNIHD